MPETDLAVWLNNPQQDESDHHHPMVAQIIKKCIPDYKKRSFRDLEERLPSVQCAAGMGGSNLFSIRVLAPYRADGGRFLYEMITKWLLPGRKIALSSFYLAHFKMHELEKRLYLAGEALVVIRTKEELDLIEHNLSPIKKELELGLSSLYHAKKILELKGISNDDKMGLIQEKITHILYRFPRVVDYDIFALMQRFVISSSEEYKSARTVLMLSRIIAILYVFARQLAYEVEERAEKRHLKWKIMKVEVQTLFGKKKVLGCFIGLNFIKENERFDKNHLLKAMETHVPGIRIVEDSYFAPKAREEGLQTFYVEVDKEDGEEFSYEEFLALREYLPRTLNDHVESLEYQVFAQRNEEEVMKYIVLLCRQIKRIKDLPQIVIMFDEQRDQRLFFTVIMVRPLPPRAASLRELTFIEEMEITIDRVKQVGSIRKRAPIEASVFRVSLAAELFLREDYSVDLYRARKMLFDRLESSMGELRDFNGGMISKQREVFLSFKEMVMDAGEKNQLLLENFFHALYPIELRSMVHAAILKNFYFLFLELLHSSKRCLHNQDDMRFFIILRLQDESEKREIIERVKELSIPSSHLVWLDLCMESTHFLGYIFLSKSAEEQQRFISIFAIIPELDYTLGL